MEQKRLEQFAREWLATSIALLPGGPEARKRRLQLFSLQNAEKPHAAAHGIQLTLRRPDEHWQSIIDERFTREVAVANARPIARQQPVPTDKLRPTDERVAYVGAAGFRWSSFNILLHALQFWACLGPATDFTRDWSRFQVNPSNQAGFALALNLLNGGARMGALGAGLPLDYEGILQRASGAFQVLKRDLYQQAEGGTELKLPSSMSVPALITGLIMDIFGREMPPPAQQEFYRLCGRVLDLRVQNRERIQDYHALDRLREEAWGSGLTENAALLFDLLASADEELDPHVGVATEDNLGLADVIITLHGGDCAGAAWEARRLMAGVAHNAVLLACGGQMPLKVKTLSLDGDDSPREAEEMVAAARISRFVDPFRGMPGAEDRTADIPPLSAFRVLPPDETSVDTKGNVANARAVLEAYQRACESW